MEGQQFSGRVGFILASIGSAVGLGSIWKFPYEVGENGGAAFLLFYLLGLLLVVVPLLLAEFVVGRRGRTDIIGSIAVAARADGRSPAWAAVGVLAVGGSFLILTYYAVIAGMTMDYALRSIVDGFRGTDARHAQAIYDGVIGDPLRLAAWQAAFLAITVAIVARGVAGGIETACTILMPVLALSLVALAAYAAVTGDMGRAAAFMLMPRPEALTAAAALEALGLGFFSIGVGFGAMATYAAYAGKDVRLGAAAAAIVIGDTALSLVSGLAVFPLVFAHGLDPAAGSGLVFVTLPIAFGRLPAGDAIAAGFFLLLFIAALATTLSLVELVVAPLERRAGWRRGRAAVAVGLAAAVGGIPTVLSYNVWKDVRPVAGLDLYGLIDGVASNIVLPVAGILFALLVGRAMPAAAVADALGWKGAAAQRLRALLRWPVPVLIALLVVGGVWLR
ncbi:MAG: sodium-dependent transporter [Alphaproteobacteria bacterium]